MLKKRPLELPSSSSSSDSHSKLSRDAVHNNSETSMQNGDGRVPKIKKFNISDIVNVKLRHVKSNRKSASRPGTNPLIISNDLEKVNPRKTPVRTNVTSQKSMHSALKHALDKKFMSVNDQKDKDVDTEPESPDSQW